MGIPTQFGVDVKTPEPLTIKIDVSERTMLLGGFIVIVAAVTLKRLKK
ncbi:hypothetical protein SD340_001121 [Vibrio fluvialis]|nr:hypothetical protein [Vibrio sp. LQ2]EKO3452649.1 hypothetical protein [Vibrio fluvialis]ELC0658524.1 hypothetical protein [Vibrio fluvialis]ELL4666667.1 hypothetical protein [Vibrio fluvialis]ELU8399306.1 hypothetical protein [Vibrio fluvialis]MBY7942599.1 hypothetical protein [Vibrio fluvialis]